MIAENDRASASTFEGKRRARASSCSTACWWRSAAGRTRRSPGSSSTQVAGRRARLHRGRRRSGGPHEPSIFAIGDVVGEPMLAHKASHEGRVRGRSDRRARTSRSSRARFRPSCSPIPRSPGRASPRRRPKERGSEVDVAKFPWGASGRAITLDRTDGLTKLIIDPGDRARARRGHRRSRRRRADRRRRAGDRDGRATRPT